MTTPSRRIYWHTIAFRLSNLTSGVRVVGFDVARRVFVASRVSNQLGVVLNVS